jgi:hypothetical protein
VRRPESRAKIATMSATISKSQRKLLSAAPPATAKMTNARTINQRSIEVSSLSVSA